MIKDIRKLYSDYCEHERIRLKQDPYHSIEFSTTFMFLEKYLQKGGLYWMLEVVPEFIL
jgi:hypothetical protein